MSLRAGASRNKSLPSKTWLRCTREQGHSVQGGPGPGCNTALGERKKPQPVAVWSASANHRDARSERL